MSNMHLGLYIHIPFCKKKCLYCDFPSYAQMEYLHDAYIAALCREIAAQGGNLHAYVVDSIYIGGGTPTILTGNVLQKIIDCLVRKFILTSDCEISIEANPGTIDKEKLLLLRKSGINRLSIGVQAFDDQLLAAMGRIHTAREAINSVDSAQNAGFENINVDLMYGLPGQSLENWKQAMTVAAGLGIQHVSAYGLKVEEGTPFAVSYAANLLKLPDEITEEAMYDLMVDFLPRHGYKRYEISNYSEQEKECRHNLKYWHYEPYVGLGAAAHSFLDGQRFANNLDVLAYINDINNEKSVVTFSEKVDKPVAAAEFIFLALRTVQGVNFTLFKKYFGVDVLDIYSTIIKELTVKELVIVDKAGFHLTSRGMKYGNIVFEAFLP